MFAKDSRYASLPERKFHPEDGGRPIRYISRRLIPRSTPVRGELRAQGPLRLDLVAYREIGKPVLFWRICDVNPDQLNPYALEQRAGEILKIPDV